MLSRVYKACVSAVAALVVIRATLQCTCVRPLSGLVDRDAGDVGTLLATQTSFVYLQCL